MALLDLSLVTSSLTALLNKRIPGFDDWPANTALTVSSGAPDLVTGAHALSLYLYHVVEDAHTKSQPWGADDSVPQRFRPMGLTLHYVLTPRSSNANPDLRAKADQLMFGLALKTLRDQAVIDDLTAVEVNGAPELVMPLALRGRGNRFRIVLRSTPLAEAGQYWQAGSQPARLAAYYEVAASLLEPDEPKVRAGRVLTLGVHALVRGRPWVEATSNRLSFTVPGELDPRTLELSPAEVPYGQTLHVRGSDLKGDTTALLLMHESFAAPRTADAAWNLHTNGTVLSATVRASLAGQPLLPGLYDLTVRTTARKTLPDGSQRDFEADSNPSRFAVAPCVLGVAGPGPVFTLTVDQFEPHALAATDLLFFVGAFRMTRVGAGPAAAGEFFTPANPAPARVTLRFRYPPGVAAGSVLPLRLVVRGAESGPFWGVAG